MKRNICIVVLPLLLFSSCKLLEENPRDRISSSEAYASKTNLYLSTVANLYSCIGGNSDSQGLQGTYRGVYDFNTFTADCLILPIRGGDWYDGGFWQRLFLHGWEASDEHLLATWEYLYKVVVMCGDSLETIRSSDLLTDEEREQWSAEVRSLRAVYYWYLCDMFGRIPIIGVYKQATRSQAAEYIAAELTECIPLLSSERSNAFGEYYGHITQAVGWFVLAKIALNCEVYFDDDWTDSVKPSGSEITFTLDGRAMNAWECVVYCCERISALGYSLDSTPDAPFAVNNEVSKENIFTIPMDRNLYSNQYQYHFRSLHYLHGSALGFSAENGTCATKETLEDFGYGTSSLDSRFALDFFADSVKVDGAPVLLDDGTPLVYQPLEIALNLTGSPFEKTAGARMLKYAIDPDATKDSKLQGNDIVLYRYADVLLMEAEAKLRQASSDPLSALTLSSEAAVLLCEVRLRAGMSARAATLDNILKERRLELCCEGWRRQDLIRFGKFTSAWTDHPQDADAHTTVFPIPASIITLNSGSLSQNPGY